MRSSKPVQRRVLKLPVKTIVLSVATLLLPHLIRAGPIGPPPNPAARANIKRNQVGVYHQSKTSGNSGFTTIRAGKRLKYGTVFHIEQTLGRQGKPKYAQVSVASSVKLPRKLLLQLGFRTPEIGKGKSLTKSDFGLILATAGGKTKLEVHDIEGAGTKYTAGRKIGKRGFGIDAALSEAGYLEKTKTVSVGANNLQKLLEGHGVNLGKLSTSLGMNFPEGKKGNVYISIVKPFGNTAIGIQGRSIGGEKEAVAGFVSISW